MFEITPKLLGIVFLNCSKSHAELYAPLLSQACEEFKINNRLRIAHFLGQIGVESGELRFTQESASGLFGDGQRYLGHGLIQITGQTDHERCFTGLGLPTDSDPSLLTQPVYAARSAAWYFCFHGCNELADARKIAGITRRINGGMTDFNKRSEYTQRALVNILDDLFEGEHPSGYAA